MLQCTACRVDDDDDDADDDDSLCIHESLLAAAGDVHNLQQQCPHNVHKT